MKIKKTTYGEFKKRFGGLRRLTVNRVDGILKIRKDLMPMEYMVNVCYKRKKDCTYIAYTCLGYLALVEPRDDKPTIICKLEGKVTTDDLTNKDFAHRKELEAIMEELENDWRKELESRKEG